MKRARRPRARRLALRLWAEAALQRRRIGPVAQSLRSVAVAPIEGRAGWLVRTALEDRLGAPERAAARYRLEVELDDDITGFGIRSDDAVTRERRTLAPATGWSMPLRAPSFSTRPPAPTPASTSVGSEYATVAAEQTALERLAEEVADQIVTRVALYASRSRRRAVKAKRPQIERALRRPATPLLPAPRPRRIGFARPDPDARQGARRRCRAGRAERPRSQGRSGPARRRGRLHLPVRRRPLHPRRAGRRRDASPALEALIEAPAAGNPVILVAGGLQPASKLLKLALAETAAMAFASYAPEGAMPTGWCSTWRASAG